MAKHASFIRLDAARRAWFSAQESCPHWDYEASQSGGDHDCCFTLRTAEHELNLARAAHKRETAPR